MNGPDLARLSPTGYARWLEAYEAGATHGYQRGYDAAVQDMAALHRQNVRMVQAIAREPDYATLAERRGEHARADRQRQILAGRGIA